MTSSILLQSCAKVFGDKARRPEDTVAWVTRRLQRATPGVFEGTRRIDRGRLDIPVYISLAGPAARELTGRQGQMGKGPTPVQAEASAIMELVERFSLEAFVRHVCTDSERGPRPGRDDAWEQLAWSVHDSSRDIERLIPVLETLPLGWVWARNLARGCDQPMPFGWYHQIHETNGAAAGNSLEEAAVQALCEVVERHVTSVVAHEQVSVPAIDPASCTGPKARGLLEKFRRNGIRVYLLDFSLGTGIPSVGALAYDPKTWPQSSDLVFATGTATTPEQALVRALTEVAQLGADFQARTRYHPGAVRFDSLEEARFLTETPHSVPLSSLPSLESDDLNEEVRGLARRLKASGLDVLLADITHPALMVPAVYVVVPGAHFRERTRAEGVLFHTARLVATIRPPHAAVDTLRRLNHTFGARYETAFFLGFGLERAGKYGEALAWFATARDRVGARRHTAIDLHIGICHYQLGELDAAIGVLSRATENALPDAEGLKSACHLLGTCLMARGRYVEAMETLQRAAEIDASTVWDYAAGSPPVDRGGALEPATHLFSALQDMDGAMERVRAKLREMRIRIEM